MQFIAALAPSLSRYEKNILFFLILLLLFFLFAVLLDLFWDGWCVDSFGADMRGNLWFFGGYVPSELLKIINWTLFFMNLHYSVENRLKIDEKLQFRNIFIFGGPHYCLSKIWRTGQFFTFSSSKLINFKLSNSKLVQTTSNLFPIAPTRLNLTSIPSSHQPNSQLVF